MAMRKENIGREPFLVFEKRIAERSQAGSGIENDDALAAANFDARCVSAVTDRIWARTGDTSPDPPKPDPH